MCVCMVMHISCCTITVVSSPEVTADTLEGGVSLSVHTTISDTVTTIVIATTLRSVWPITLVESGTEAITSCIMHIKTNTYS